MDSTADKLKKAFLEQRSAQRREFKEVSRQLDDATYEPNLDITLDSIVADLKLESIINDK